MLSSYANSNIEITLIFDIIFILIKTTRIQSKLLPNRQTSKKVLGVGELGNSKTSDLPPSKTNGNINFNQY